MEGERGTALPPASRKQVAEIFDVGLRAGADIFVLVAGAFVITTLLVDGLAALLLLALEPLLRAFGGLETQPGLVVGIGVGVSVCVSSLAALLPGAIAAIALADRESATAATAANVLRRAVRTLPRLVLSFLSFATVVALGTLGAIVSGFFPLTLIAAAFVIYGGFFDLVCVVEGRGPIAAIERSLRLVVDNFWRTVGIGLLFGMFIGATALAIYVLIALPAEKLLGLKMGEGIAALNSTSPFDILCMALLSSFLVGLRYALYRDLVARREELDRLTGVDQERVRPSWM